MNVQPDFRSFFRSRYSNFYPCKTNMKMFRSISNFENSRERKTHKIKLFQFVHTQKLKMPVNNKLTLKY